MDSLQRDVLDAFGSFTDPNWSFVMQRLDDGWYGDVARKLAATTDLVETTDLNDDNSRCFSVGKAPESLGLRLSLVGRYACIQSSGGAFLSAGAVSSSLLGRQVLDVLATNGIVLLDDELLETRIEFGGESMAWFEILFSQEELPR